MTSNDTRVDIDRVANLFAHRVARAPELMRLGTPAATIYQRCMRGGPWRRLMPEVILLANSPPTRTQLVQAALRYAGDGAIVTGPDAVALHGLHAPRTGPVHLLVPRHRRLQHDPAVVVEHCRDMPNPVLRRGFLVTALPRAAIDTARTMTDAIAVRALLDDVVHRGKVGAISLQAELSKAGRHGTPLVRQVLDDLADRLRATDESMARRFLRAAGLPPPRWRVELVIADGTSHGSAPCSSLGTVAAWWPEVGMAWELDGFAEHLTPERYGRTIAKHARLIARGVLVVHSTPSRLKADQSTLADELRRSYACARQRPTPEDVLPRNGNP